jgi:hypothetical protein
MESGSGRIEDDEQPIDPERLVVVQSDGGRATTPQPRSLWMHK